MKQDEKTVGCIGGGNMGSAIIMKMAEETAADNCILFDIDKDKAAQLGKKHAISLAKSAAELADRSDIIILAVKPDVVPEVLSSIKESVSEKKIIVSIAAGITIASIEKITGSKSRIIRAMPNTPAQVGFGMTVLSPNSNIDDTSLTYVEKIFTKIGKVLVMPETMMDAVTAVSGSGPAYVFTFIQALADGGVKLGIPRAKAQMLAAQTVLGSARYVLESNEDPMTLRGKVTSPGGTTIEAIHVLERSGFSGIVMDAVEAAALKSKKLGEK